MLLQKLEPDASNANQQVSHELEEAIRMSVAEAHAQEGADVQEALLRSKIESVQQQQLVVQRSGGPVDHKGALRAVPQRSGGAHGATRETAGTCPKARGVCVTFGRISAKQRVLIKKE